MQLFHVNRHVAAIHVIRVAISAAVSLVFLAGANPAFSAEGQLERKSIDDDLLLVNGQIVDPLSESVRLTRVLIRNGIISEHLDETPKDFSGSIVDLKGKWLIPALTDMHTHSFGNRAPGGANEFIGTAEVARRMLYAGVSGFVDLFGDEDDLYAVRRLQRDGEIGGSDISASLSCLTATDGHCTEYGVETRVMNTPEEARRVVASLDERAPDVVKIVYSPSGRLPSIDKPTLEAAVSEATRRGLKTIIHVDTWDDVRDSIDVGASAVTHLPPEPVPDRLPALMANKGVAIIPTIVVDTEYLDFVEDPSVLDNPLAKALTTEEIVEAYRSDAAVQRYNDRKEKIGQDRAAILKGVKTLSDAGVTILVGSDSGNWGTIQGYSVHRELIKMTEAGLSPWQAIAASTVDAGAFLGRRFGVNPGDEANLIVLNSSPIRDIRSTQDIAMVIHHGKIVDRDALLLPCD